MTAVPTTVTIDDALDAFLAEQRERLSPKTLRNYEDVVSLLRSSLNGYAYQSLDGLEEKRWRKAFDAGDEDAFTKLFGPEKIVEHLGEFLGYFMIRKVFASQELLRAAGTVTKKLASWLHAQGCISEDEWADAVERGGDAARELPRAEQLGELLHDEMEKTPPSTRTRSLTSTGSRTSWRSSASSPAPYGSRVGSVPCASRRRRATSPRSGGA
jgi:hypothetical protein